MSSTINLLKSANSIYASIQSVLQKDAQVDAEFAIVNSEIDTRYKAKVAQLETARNQRVAGATAQVQGQQQQFQAALTELSKIENGIPSKFRKKYRKTTAATFVPKNPDFQAMTGILTRINDATFSGHAKRIVHYGGYASMSEMVNALLDEIESARAFINGENQKCVTFVAQTRVAADQEFQREKADADKKRPVYIQQNQQNYDAATAALRTELERVLGSPELPKFDESLLSILGQLGAFEDDWNVYTPADTYPDEIMLGAIDVPFSLSSPVCDMVKERMPVAYASGRSITIPFTASMNEPLNLQVQYEPKQKVAVMGGIQSIILKLIRFIPAFSFCFTYIDPNDRGTNLGLLQKLSASLASDIFKKVYASKEDIAKRLKELEAFVDQTSAELAGVDSVYTYNATHEAKIPYHFVVINDYPDNFERNTLESLMVLLNNSRKCGISFIFTSSNQFGGQVTSDILIQARNNGSTVSFEDKAYDFMFDGIIPNCDAFIESVKTVYNDGIKIDNRFVTFFKLTDTASYMESTKCIRIPFAVDSTKHLVSMELGGTQSVNALLSGRTGSGKSTTLHMLISSIVMNYHPDDVELWLVDYKKVEFSEYIQFMPPHIRLLGLERSHEFTFSLLDKLNEEFQRRLELFKSKGVSSITEYKEKYGVHSLPRVIFAVDEFHQMTQAIRNEPYYVQILENILSEYRAFGLSCVFSDQAISDGLRGFTEKGRKQISIRIAMENDMSEVRETLALDNSLYDDSLKNKILRMSQGDVIFKRFTDDGDIVLDKYKTIYISREERIEVIKRAIRLSAENFLHKDVLIIDGQTRREYEESVVTDYEQRHSIDLSRQIPIYVGTPVNLDPCFSFGLRKKTDANIMLIGSEDDLRASILLHAIYTFKRQPKTSVVVFAYKTDELYRQYKCQISELLSDSDLVITELSDVCSNIEKLLSRLNADNEHRTLVCWLGLEEIADELSVQQDKSKVSRDNQPAPTVATGSVDSLISEMDALLNSFDTAETKTEPKEAPVVNTSSLYDARPEIQELFVKGSRFNMYSFVTFSSVKMIRQTKFVKTENFENKIALSMSMDDSATYLGRGAYASGLDNLSAVYDDGSGSIRTFRPYLII